MGRDRNCPEHYWKMLVFHLNVDKAKLNPVRRPIYFCQCTQKVNAPQLVGGTRLQNPTYIGLENSNHNY